MGFSGGGSGTSVTAIAFGTLAARPGASVSNQNTFYYATDIGELSMSDGSTWHHINALGGDAAVGNIAIFDTAHNKQQIIDLGNNENLAWLSGGFPGIGASGGSDIHVLNGANLRIDTAGKGLAVKEGASAKQGTGVLAAGTVTIANTSVTANSRIFLTLQNLAGAALPQALYVSAVVPGVSFTVTSASGIDTSTFAYEIFEPG